MRDYLADLVRSGPADQGRNLIREYLQARILGSLQRSGAMVSLAFHGGTALRFLYGSARYSEDLDFSLERATERYDLRTYLRAIRSSFVTEGYILDMKISDRRVVHSAFIRFPELLYQLGLSPRREAVMAVKVEVDTHPPAGAVLATTVVRRQVTLQLQHHDRASLLAGKLHAILQRPYLKGRDVYDLLWYLSDPDWPAPNLTFLNNALLQTGWTGGHLDGSSWREAVRQRLHMMRWDRVIADVRPLLDVSADIGMLTLDNVLRVLEQR